MDIKKLVEQADRMFTNRSGLHSLWQEIGENFYPERADFTITRSPGEDFAPSLYTSYPLITRRELGDQIGMMLRPTNKNWFRMISKSPSQSDNDARRWLERSENIQRNAMYDRKAFFSRAAKQSDHDYGCFGQDIIQLKMNMDLNVLYFKNQHLKDVAWDEDHNQNIYLVARRWSPTNRMLMSTFGDKCHKTVKDIAGRDPFSIVKCFHIMIMSEYYDTKNKRMPWVSLYYDQDHQHLMEEKPAKRNEYIISRWATMSNSVYAFSPATIIGLADARLIQSMAFTLLEAGEKLVNPPMVATKDAVRSDVSIYAGGITWIDKEYDEKMGEALRPMNINANGMPLGLDMLQDARALLKEAFFLNKLSMPERNAEMTAYEVGQRVQEYIRGALPIFEPMEDEKNGQLCEAVFDILLDNGAFGPLEEIPKSLRGRDIEFRFESPLHDAIEEQKGHKFVEMKNLVIEAMALDKQAIGLPDVAIGLRDALQGIKVPAEWIRSETTVTQMREAEDSLREAQELMGQLQQGADVAKTASEIQPL